MKSLSPTTRKKTTGNSCLMHIVHGAAPESPKYAFRLDAVTLLGLKKVLALALAGEVGRRRR